MGAEACSGCGGVGLDGVALVEIAFLVELTEEPPYGLDVAVVVCDIGVGHVDPVAHAAGEVFPFAGILHHLAAAGGVVVIDRDFLADVLLGDAEILFNAKFDGETVGVPTGLAFHLIALHGLVAAENVLDGAGQDVVNAGFAIGGGRTFEKYERGATFAFRHCAGKHIFISPLFKDGIIDFRQLKAVVFRESL